MPNVSELIATLDRHLAPERFDDFGPNGVQVPGRDEVRRVVTGVSATRALIDRAVEMDADLVLVHHGLFWSSQGAGLTRQLAERLRPLLEHRIGLAAYHLPLDAHPELGNNAILAERLGCEGHEPFADIGRAGRFAPPGLDVAQLVARVREATSREPLVLGSGPERIRRIAIVSGGAAGYLARAAGEGFDAFLTGEPKEHVMGDAVELGVHFVAAGHYATETFGVRALGELLAREHGIEHIWVDLPNPV